MQNYKLLLGIFILLAGSCKKDELPVDRPDKGDLTTVQAEMSSDYKFQLYFDLQSNTFRQKNLKKEWDLGFSCDPQTSSIVLNTAKLMYAAPITNKTFAQISDTSGFGINKQSDNSNGDPSQTAFAAGNLFIVDKGMDESGVQLGFFKIEILSSSPSNYQIRIANLDGSNEQNHTIVKDEDYNFIFVNWSNGLSIKSIEPPKSTWDLQFTQYTHLFHEPEYTQYLVTGCLLNHYNTKAVQVNNISFDAIDLNYAQGILLSEEINTIGYDWKEFNGSQYTIFSDKIYIIQDAEGFYYKLRFIDFYNLSGQKGYPTFEYQQL